MSRYCKTLELYKVERVSDSKANPIMAEVEGSRRKVFANQYTLGMTSWAAGASRNLHADAVFTVRTGEYKGEQRAVCGEDEYEVEEVSAMGEHTRLVLRRRLANA